MKLTVQVIVHPEDDAESPIVVREVFAVDRDALAADTLGLHLSEAKVLLAAVQDTLVEHQVDAAITKQVACPRCGGTRRHKDSRPIVMRTLFGTLRVDSPSMRWASATSCSALIRAILPIRVRYARTASADALSSASLRA